MAYYNIGFRVKTVKVNLPRIFQVRNVGYRYFLHDKRWGEEIGDDFAKI